MSAATVQVQLRVTSVRSRGAFGGVIFAGKDEAGRMYVVKADYKLIPDASFVEEAQVWRVAGVQHEAAYSQMGIAKTETQIAPTELELQRPSGKTIVDWIARSEACRGIGDVRARRLYERFGLELLTLIEDGDVGQLAEVVDVEAAEALVAAFARYAVAPTLVWLEQIGLPKEIAASVVGYWAADAKGKVEANPYVLTSFCGSWKTVDALAMSRFGVVSDDSRRLIAAAEEALYRGMNQGHTALPVSEVKAKLRQLLGSTALADRAVNEAVAEGTLVEEDDLLQPAGLAFIENFVAESLSTRLAGGTGGQGEMFGSQACDELAVAQHLALYQSMHGIELAPEQISAVITTAISSVSLILGGAGTGKTTVLKALCHVLERTTPGVQIHQFALAGRAAQRMSASTGRPAGTIAAFFNDPQVAPGATVLIDEMSMVDVLLMYRFLRELPEGVRLVMIGDPAQLPPIGPGLVLHVLANLEVIPKTTLKTVKRQSSASGIPQVASAVRAHLQPSWAPYGGLGAGVSVVPCDSAQIDETVAKIYEEIGGSGSDFSVQILGVTKGGPGGVKSLNALVHNRFSAKKLAVWSVHQEFGQVMERTDDGLSLFAGDLVMFGANDYALGLRNGSLGKLLRPVTGSNTSLEIVIADFEGVEYPMTAAQVRHIKHAYAITTHKAQGSQFDRVIVPITANRLLDNALIYTAITRGVSQVVLVGNIDAAEQAIRSASNASKRVTRLIAALARHACPARLPHPEAVSEEAPA